MTDAGKRQTQVGDRLRSVSTGCYMYIAPNVEIDRVATCVNFYSISISIYLYRVFKFNNTVYDL